MGELLRWNDLIAYLETHHAGVQTFPADRFRFEYKRDGAPARYADGTAITFGGYLLRSPAGMPWIVLALKIAPHEEVRPRPALVATYDLPFGAIATVGDYAVVRQSLPLTGLRTETLETLIKNLARLAEELRTARSGPTSGDEPFDAPYAYIYR